MGLRRITKQRRWLSGLAIPGGVVAVIIAALILIPGVKARSQAAPSCSIVLQTVTFNAPNEVRFQLKNVASIAATVTGLDPFNYTIASGDLLDWIEWPNNTVVYNGDAASGAAIVFSSPVIAKKDATVNVTMAWTGTITPSEVQFTIQSDQGTCMIGTGITAPVAQADAITTPTDVPQIADVLNNDYDPDGNPITLTRVFSTVDAPGGVSATTDQGGTVTIDNSGTTTEPSDDFVNYTPPNGFSGQDGFSYEICDPTPLCATAVVTVTVGGVNTGPTAVDDSATTNEDTEVVINAAGNDTDPQNNLDPGSITLQSLPSHGVAVPHATNGTITYAPNANVSGVADSFEYEICDTGSLCDTAIVRVTINPVNDPPTALADSAKTNPGKSVAIPVLGNDFDIDSIIDPSSVLVVTPPGNGSARPDPATGQIVYTAGNGYVGTTKFTYRVCDVEGACSNPAEVTIKITEGNSQGGGGQPPIAGPPPVPLPSAEAPTSTSTAPGAVPVPPKIPSATLPAPPPAAATDENATDSQSSESAGEAGSGGSSESQDEQGQAGETGSAGESTGLILRLSSDQSQAAPGQMVVVTILLENAGTIPISDLIATHRLDGPGVPGGIELAIGQLRVDQDQIEWNVGQLDPGEQTVLTLEVLVTGSGDNLTICASATGAEASADEVCSRIRVSALALPQFAEDGSGPVASGGSGPRAHQDTNEQCLALLGIRVTCFPWIRWLLFAMVLAADGWLVWSSLRQRGESS